jgi:hypothetical protein
MALAAVLMALCQINLYPLNGLIERLAFALCPFYRLGFAPISWIALVAIVLFASALQYGAIFAVIGAVAGAFTRKSGRVRVSSF